MAVRYLYNGNDYPKLPEDSGHPHACIMKDSAGDVCLLLCSSPVLALTVNGKELADSGETAIGHSADATRLGYRRNNDSWVSVEVTSEEVDGATYAVFSGYSWVWSNEDLPDQKGNVVYEGSAVVEEIYAADPSITTNLTEADYTHVPGQTVKTLTVKGTSPDGGTISYQWYRDGMMPIEGATGESYTPPTDKLGMHTYRCKVTNNYEGYTGDMISNTVMVVTVDESISFAAGLMMGSKIPSMWKKTQEPEEALWETLFEGEVTTYKNNEYVASVSISNMALGTPHFTTGERIAITLDGVRTVFTAQEYIGGYGTTSYYVGDISLYNDNTPGECGYLIMSEFLLGIYSILVMTPTPGGTHTIKIEKELSISEVKI